jgi:hypothetical protein
VIRRLALTVGAAALLAVPATAVAAPNEKAPPKPRKQEAPKATVTIDVQHLRGGVDEEDVRRIEPSTRERQALRRRPGVPQIPNLLLGHTPFLA